MATLLQDFTERVEREGLEIHGICVQQHGVFLEEHRWRADTPNELHSLSKSYTATAVGMAIDEGRFTLQDKVIDFFPEYLPEEITPELAAMTVRDLLVMAPGRDKPSMMNVQRPFIMDPEWVHYYLSQPFDRMPGEKFAYDTGCTYVLGAIVQQVSGQKVVDYLMPRLFEPLGMEKPMWRECPKGRNVAGAGLHLRTHEILPFGQLMLQKGCWGDRQLVSEDWVREATSAQISNAEGDTPDGTAGYGYQFWMCRNGSYRGDGAHCQLCIVSDALDAVVTITAQEDRSQAVMNAVWDTVYPKLAW